MTPLLLQLKVVQWGRGRCSMRGGRALISCNREEGEKGHQYLKKVIHLFLYYFDLQI
jgi:hypothetical protein